MITTLHGHKHTMHGLVTTVVVLAIAILGMAGSATAQYGTVSYQGLLTNGSVPVNGHVNLDVSYYYTGSTDPIFTETFSNVPVSNGMFNLALGSTIGNLPAYLDLTKTIQLGIRVNQSTELSPRAELHAVPYAMTSHTLEGIPASATPTRGAIFPMPMDEHNQILRSMLPPNDGITNIAVGEGLTGGGTTGLVEVGLDAGNIPGSYLKDGSIAGLKMSADFAGNGLLFDPLGSLALRVDTNQFTFQAQKLRLRPDAPVSGTTGMLNSLEVLGETRLNTDGQSSTTVGGALFVAGGLDVAGLQISNVGYPVRVDDAVSARYVDNQISSAIATMATPQFGTFWVYNTSDKKQKTATATLYNAALTPSSVIMLTVEGPSAQALAPRPPATVCYSASFNNLQEGSADITIGRTEGDFDSEEGALVHYVIYNTQYQPEN